MTLGLVRVREQMCVGISGEMQVKGTLGKDGAEVSLSAYGGLENQKFLEAHLDVGSMQTIMHEVVRTWPWGITCSEQRETMYISLEVAAKGCLWHRYWWYRGCSVDVL